METKSTEQLTQVGQSVDPTNPTHHEPKKNLRSKSNIVLLVFGGILFLVLVGGISYYLGVQKGRSLAQSQIETAQTNVNQQDSDLVTSYNVYKNDKYGFEIKLPSSLKVNAIDYDIQSDQREYIRKCDSGEIDGCGGSRWPDYQVKFQDGLQQTLFTVDIHVIPVVQYLGGKENNGFTYYVSAGQNTQGEFMPGVTETVIDSIENSLSFISAENPVQCLWTPEFVAVDINRPVIDKNIYSQASGYYFDQKTQHCAPISLYHGDGPNIPFQEMQSCTSTCVE